jgi:hypothetical protein
MGDDNRIWRFNLILHDHESEPWIGLHEIEVSGERLLNFTPNPVTFSFDPSDSQADVIAKLERALNDAKTNPILIESEIEARNNV